MSLLTWDDIEIEKEGNYGDEYEKYDEEEVASTIHCWPVRYTRILKGEYYKYDHKKRTYIDQRTKKKEKK